ncbi:MULTISPECIES: iron-sulfur cluster assembly scaffold protein [Desulfosediminicola]|uniref:iron-sulfur cluster assembly scaffold protein n=1 Tax=Desulfosediminicola TaxID=2886823 RepID=UPI0010AD1FE3|nr:iron-sulfur cluster assembly scaffold protein [Desulfosediminicola ganghwensis]
MSLDDYSDEFIIMAYSYDRYGVMEAPDGFGTRTGDCGDTVEFYLLVENERVEGLTFQINGCLNTFACANTISYLAEGCQLSECWEITPEKIIEYLKTLPADHHHCAELAVGAFYHSLNDYTGKRRQ